MIAHRALLVVLASLVATPAALAQDVDPRLYDPALSPGGVLSVEGSCPAAHLAPWGALTGSWANDELTTRAGPGDDDLKLGPLRNRLVTSLAAGLGLFDVLDLAVAAPLHLTEREPSDPTDTARELGFGLGDLRLFARARVFGPEQGKDGFGLALLADVTFPTGGEQDFRGDGAVTVTPRLAFDYRGADGFLLALNAGYRLRSARTVVDLVVGDELKLGVAGELPLGVYGLSALGEVHGAVGFGGVQDASGAGRGAVDGPSVTARYVPFEALGGLRWRGPDAVTVSLAAGAGLTEGYGAPDFRVAFAVTIGGPQVDPFTEPFVGPDGRVAAAPAAAPLDGAPAGDILDGASTDAAMPPLPAFDAAAFDAAAAADPDPDGDALAGAADACPSAAEDRDGFEDGDGCPDPDNDRDGVLDPVDRCPTEAEVFNGVDDDDGCPDEGEAPTDVKRDGMRISFEGVIRFHPGSAQLSAPGRAVLDRVAVVMNGARDVRRFRVEGHTDSVGDREFNVDLSERRAASVRGYLIAHGGVAPERLFAKGYGATRPVANNATTRGRAKNRRVEFHIIRPGQDGWPEDEAEEDAR